MFRIEGQWYKISGVHEIKYRFGQTWLGLDINAIDGAYPRFAWEADSFTTKAAYWLFKDKEWGDAVNYIRRIKREVNTSILGI